MCLFRAVDGSGQTVDFFLSETRDREAAKIFLKRAMAWRAIQGIKAAQMIRKGQVLGTTRGNMPGQAWAFAALLGVK